MMATAFIIDVPNELSPTPSELDVVLGKSEEPRQRKYNSKHRLETLEKYETLRKQIAEGFSLKPGKLHFCRYHTRTQIEFYCPVLNQFYCRICVAERHEDHLEDIPLSTIQAEVQNNMTALKHKYLTKKTHILDRLLKQK
jgi:hypothetical protein